MESKLLNVREVAAILSVSQNTVRRLIETGDLPHVKIRGSIRIIRESLEDFVIKHETKLERNKRP